MPERYRQQASTQRLVTASLQTATREISMMDVLDPTTRQLSDVLDPTTRQLSKDSTTRRKAAITHALATIETQNPSPVPSHIPKGEMNLIFKTAKEMGLNPVTLAQTLGKENRLGAFRRAYLEAYNPKPTQQQPFREATPTVLVPATTSPETHPSTNGHPTPDNDHSNAGHHTHHDAHDEHPTHSADDNHSLTGHGHGHNHTTLPIETRMRNAVKNQGRIGAWRDKRIALRRAKRGKAVSETEHQMVMQEILQEQTGDFRETLTARQQRQFDRLTPDQQTTVVGHLAERKATQVMKPPLPKWWGPFAGTASFIIGVAQIMAGNPSKILETSGEAVVGTLLNGAHDLGDVSYALQAALVRNKKEISPEIALKRRTIIYSIIEAGLAIGAIKAGIDMTSPDKEATENVEAVIATGGSLAINLGLGVTALSSFNRQKRQGIPIDIDKKDTLDHLKTDLAFSSIATLCAVFAASKLYIPVEEILILLGTSYAGWRFRPTRYNLANAHSHGHGHGHQSHEQLTTETNHQKQETRAATIVQRPKKSRRLSRWTAGVAVAGVLAAGPVVVGKITNASGSVKASGDVQTSITTHQPTAEAMSPKNGNETAATNLPLSHIVYQQAHAREGDTHWDTASEQLASVNPTTNWKSPYGSTRNDVVIDFSRDMQEQKTGSNLNTVNLGDVLSVVNNLSPEEVDLMNRILDTKTYKEFKKIIPEIQAFYTK